MKLGTIVLVLGLLSPLAGCDTNVDEDSSSGTEGNTTSNAPSDESVAGCRDGCDRLQFFDCIDGSVHETCWNTCAERSDDDLELFESCVNNSAPACDPDCLAGLIDAPEPEPDPDPDTTTGGDPSSCETVCQAYVDAGCELELFEEVTSCAQACATLSSVEQAAVAVCFNSPQTCEVDPECLLEEEEETSAADESGGGVDVSCLSACDTSLGLQCIDAQEHASCYSQCDVAPASDVEAFVACVDAVGAVCDGSCYAVFIE